MSQAPLKITLYDPATSEEKKTYTRTYVPWRLLKSAMAISKELQPDQIDETTADSIAALVVEAFGNQFTVDDLNDGADLAEMMTVLNGIVARAKGISTNPTFPKH